MLTTTQLAERLGVTRQTVDKLRARGDIPAIRVVTGNLRHTYRYQYDDVIDALKLTTDKGE